MQMTVMKERQMSDLFAVRQWTVLQREMVRAVRAQNCLKNTYVYTFYEV